MPCFISEIVLSRYYLSLCLLVAACSGEKDAASSKQEQKTVEPTQGPASGQVKQVDSPPAKVAPSYQDELKKLDARIANQLDRQQKLPKSAVVRSQLAGLYSSRAKLTGKYEEYDKAKAVLDPAFTSDGAGAFPARASLRYTLHDMEGALEDVQRAMAPPQVKTAGLYSLRGSLHFHAARYDEALKDLEAAVALKRSPSTLSRLAHYHWKTSDFDKAETLYTEAESRYHGREAETRAWIHLMRGLMDLERGRYDDALAHYQDADAAMTGWWLVREHMAEIHFLQGDLEGAAKIYKDVVEETESPELMAAYSEVLEKQGKADEAKAQHASAAIVFESRLKKWPSASSGHALEFFLEGDEPKRALALAQENHKRRPGGEATTLLARAYLGVKDVDKAVEMIEKVEGTPYRTADYHVVASEVFAAKGDSERAQKENALAMKIDQSVEALKAAP